MLGVDLVGSRRIQPAHVGCPVGPDGSRRIQKDRLDDHRDDQPPSDEVSDDIASAGRWACGEVQGPSSSSVEVVAGEVAPTPDSLERIDWNHQHRLHETFSALVLVPM
jgi:hypothetical protein